LNTHLFFFLNYTRMHNIILKSGLIFGLSFLSSKTFCQETKLIDNFEYKLTYYEGFSKTIDSLSAIPNFIIENINKYIKSSFGNLSSSIHFSHGQIIDLANYFKKNPSTYTRKYLLPKYDLEFILKDSLIGIKSYGITIKADQYGQVISCNWPREGYSDKSKFQPISELGKNAIKIASSKGFNINKYIISFGYNEKHERMCWLFQFPYENNGTKELFNVIEMDWIHMEIIDEYGLGK
ncbi:MAG: hypothetical protein J7621_22965, partial [Niastella sp.]|nr:hypothetical protein [Niastella sp.]